MLNKNNKNKNVEKNNIIYIIMLKINFFIFSVSLFIGPSSCSKEEQVLSVTAHIFEIDPVSSAGEPAASADLRRFGVQIGAGWFRACRDLSRVCRWP